MPRIVKLVEKTQCVRYEMPKITLDYGEQRKLYDMLSDIIDEILPEKVEDEFFKEFVNVKEVPYGECITDTDNRRSVTELSRLQFERNYRPSNSLS